MSFWKSLIRSERPSGVVKAVPFVSREDRGEGLMPVTPWVPQPVHESEGRLVSIALDSIENNPFQPRRRFDNERLTELAASIAEFGVLQPVTLRIKGERYQLIAGERRVRAARLAGLTEIPAILREMEDEQMAMLSLIENLQREDLNVIEEANCYARLLSDFRLTQEELARQIGRSQSSIANKLRLLRLPAQIQESLAMSLLTERHARALLRLESAEQQVEAMALFITQGMNVRQSEEWVEARLQQQAEITAQEHEPTTPTRMRRFIPKNMLLFFNEFKRVVQTMQQAGVDSLYEQDEEDDYWVVTVKVRKTSG